MVGHILETTKIRFNLIKFKTVTDIIILMCIWLEADNKCLEIY